MALMIGQPAPDFRLPDESGALRSLADYRGRPLVLYFYPADDTPGCTTEACNFRDDYGAFVKAGVEILGVSPDTPASHTKFKAKYNLPFHLLADPEREVINAYKAWGSKKTAGRDYEGVLRTTYLIDPAGRIAQVYENVKPAEHSAEILAVLAEL